MKKLFAVIAIALVVAAAVWIFVRIQLANELATVPELLPKTTLLLLHAPDLKRARDHWHESDLYQIWREPAVQAWLEKPLHHLPEDHAGRQTLAEFLQLGPTHCFAALTALENNEPKLLGGFHFAVAPEKARVFIEQREANWWPKVRDAKRETVTYGQHQIEKVSVSHFVFARVFDEHWFFISNDLAALQALLDRADHRGDKATPSLQENEAFAAARKHLPTDYAGMVFIDPRPFVEKLIPVIAMTGQSLPTTQLERLKSVTSVAAALAFDHGKMRETDFVAMPQIGTEKKLTRPLLAAAGTNTFFYSASQMYWPNNFFLASAPGASGLPALVQQFNAALTARGISTDDLRKAFGDELEVTSSWPAEARWPTIIATLPLNDPARARKIADALAAVEIAGAAWMRTERNGATIYSAQPFSGFLPLSLNLSLSDKMMFFGTDPGALEGAVTRIDQGGGDLQKSEPFRSVAGQVPPGDSAFNYIDTRLLFERLDAVIRPLLVMGATIYPALGKSIDLTKVPPPEAIAKHLSPIVMSQRYERDGYLTESIGPVTFREATIGVAAAVGSSLLYLREGVRSGGLLKAVPGLTLPSPSGPAPTPAPTPSPSPI